MARTPVDLSPRGAIMLGLVVMACGVAPVLGSLGIIPYPLTRGTPVWVGMAGGGVFILGGAALINGYVFGGGRHFDTRATPLVRAIQDVLGAGMLTMFAAIGGWIAFGPGPRTFTSSISLPFWHSRGGGEETIGRAIFGIGAIACAAMALAVASRRVRGRK